MPKVMQVLERPEVEPLPVTTTLVEVGSFPLAMAEEGLAELATRSQQLLARPAHCLVPVSESVAIRQVAPALVAQRQTEKEAAQRRAAERRATELRGTEVYPYE